MATTRPEAQHHIDEFLSYLARRGRSPYTIRSYSIALQHFGSWLSASEIGLGEVTRSLVDRYVDEFRIGIKDGAVRPSLERAGQVNALTRKSYPTPERKPTTINHRVSVLTSFFDYLVAVASWSGGLNPVRAVVAAPTHGMTGRDAPHRRRRAEFRMRAPRSLPRDLDHSSPRRSSRPLCRRATRRFLRFSTGPANGSVTGATGAATES